MRTKHSRDHADSECVSREGGRGVDRKKAEFIGNKQIHLLIHKHTDTQLYILVCTQQQVKLLIRH